MKYTINGESYNFVSESYDGDLELEKNGEVKTFTKDQMELVEKVYRIK